MSLNEHSRVSNAGGRARQTIMLALVVVLGMAAVTGVARWMDATRPPTNAALEEEKLYLTGNAARRASLGFNGLVADWYWMRALQYVGRKIIKQQETEQAVELDDLGKLDLRLLYPLLDTTTTLDPQFMAAYEYGAVVLPEINLEQAIALLQKGIKANPAAWRLYHHLGYIYWQRGDYRRASAIYKEGAQLPGAPSWMIVMSARMETEGGSRSTAREIYRRIYEQTDDQAIREMVTRRLLQLDSLDERDVIRRVLKDYAARNAGRCVSNWREVSAQLRAARLRLNEAGAPVDPTDMPYMLVRETCDVVLDARSQIPPK